MCNMWEGKSNALHYVESRLTVLYGMVSIKPAGSVFYTPAYVTGTCETFSWSLDSSDSAMSGTGRSYLNVILEVNRLGNSADVGTI